LSSRYQYERSPGGLDAVRLQNDRLRPSAHSEQRWPSLVLRDGKSQDLARSFASGAERRWSLQLELEQ